MKKKVAALLIICMISLTTVQVTQAFELRDLLKVGGISILIDKFKGPLNAFINTLTAKNSAGPEYETKVVPILTFGSGGYVGAVQVIGPKDLVEKTQAVIQMEREFRGDTFRVKALIPIDSKNPLHFSRVIGVGVSAVIEIKI